MATTLIGKDGASMPKPEPGESQDAYIDRCMADAETIAKYPDDEQRYAYCKAVWETESRRQQLSQGMTTKNTGLVR